jgi:hypothetical protein
MVPVLRRTQVDWTDRKGEQNQMPTGKSREAALAQQLIAGTKKHLSGVSSLMLEGGTFTPSQIEASLQGLIDLRTAVDDAKAAAKAKVADELAQASPLRSHMAAFVAFVKVAFGKSPDVLADFGLKPRKTTTPLTIEQKTVAAAKRKATRAARHTMGTSQKKKVKGTITTIVTPTDSKASPPVAPGPIANAPSGTSAGATPHGT